MKTSSHAGFVLLEAVVALAVISMVSLALLQARGQQIRVADQARELLTAQALAEDRLAALRLLDYDNLARPADSIMAGAFPPPFEEFSWVTTVVIQENEYDLFRVDVVVTGPAERFPLATLVHRPRAVLGGGGNGEQGFGGGGRGGAGDRAGGGGRGGGGDRAGGGGRGGDRAGPGGGGGGTDRPGRGGRGGGGGTNGPGGPIGGAGGAGRGANGNIGGGP